MFEVQVQSVKEADIESNNPLLRHKRERLMHKSLVSNHFASCDDRRKTLSNDKTRRDGNQDLNKSVAES